MDNSGLFYRSGRNVAGEISMKNAFFALAITLASVSLHASPDAASLTEEKCGNCHFSSFTTERLAQIVAPPQWVLGKQVKTISPAPEECANFIADYTFEPSEHKMRFPRETLERFGLMPSQRGSVTEAELRIIARELCR